MSSINIAGPCKYRWPYQNEVWKEEDLYKRAISFDEFIFRMGSGSKPKKE
jgi:hypothetical protein